MRRTTWPFIVVLLLTLHTQPVTASDPIYGNIVANGGFETGDLSHWSGASVGGAPPTVLFGSAHSGNFSASTGQFLYTEHYKAMPSTVYSLSAWYKTIFPSVVIGSLTIKLDWYDASDAYISSTTIFTERNTPRSHWTYSNGSATSPAGAVYLNVYLDYFGALDSYVEVDDVAVMGPTLDSFPLFLPVLLQP